VLETIEECKANILLVDDRPENLLALEATLDPLGETLWKATSGREALRHLLKEEFAVILMDARMPGMDGFETATLIRERDKTRHVPIIFVTAYGQDAANMFKGYSVGAVDFITKPFDPDIMRSKVRVFVDLYKKNEQIKRQAELIHLIELREAERRMEREHMNRLTAELEGRVAERTAELVAANRELESFCYSVSHDLRAPLRAIMATSMILLEDTKERLTEDERDNLIRQSAAAKRLGQLIDDLLHLSRLGRKSMTRSQVDVSRLAESVGAELLPRYENRPFDIRVEEGMSVRADVGLLRILYENLIENAMKYSPNGGRIEIGSEERDGERVFFVRDCGIGFDTRYIHRIFLPFERLVGDDQYPGTGIGLANAHRIVTRHGGKIWAESAVGEGASFFFTLV
jgi:two-component system, sensor histidine kinase and response regulator